MDALIRLRQAVSANEHPVPVASADDATPVASLSDASHLLFDNGSTAISLDEATRFRSAAANKALDLRSVYFCWTHKDSTTAEYVTAAQELNEQLKKKDKQSDGQNAITVTNVVFAEKLDLNAWLASEVGENESEFITGLDDTRATHREATDAAKIAAAIAGEVGVSAGDQDVEMRDAGAEEAMRKLEAERLQLIYAAERRMGDHNTVLRGIKIQDFSEMRKFSAMFLSKSAQQQQQQQQQPHQANSNNTNSSGKPGAPQPSLNPNPTLRPSSQPGSNRRLEPIILLSPSASSLVRMPNIKSFLDLGEYSAITPGSDSPTILHISRTLKSLHATHPMRFILVDDPTNFKPDYWSRVVAVFTTGQVWQFKSYKWPQPAELFSHALGVYVGWKGEKVPETVQGWGRGVLSVQLEKGAQSRWRDREVVELIWSLIEGRMKSQGWGR